MKVEFVRSNNYKDYFDTIIKLKGRYLKNAIGDTYKNWSYLRPAFFAASTGTGKSHLFETEIIKECIRMKVKVLYLNNRSADDTAGKRRLAKEINPDILENYTNKGLGNENKIGDYVYVMTYQKLATLMNDKAFNEIEFKIIIANEIEYVTDDSLFSHISYDVLKYIVRHFSESIRCYLSATPDPAFRLAYMLEKANYYKRTYNCSPGRSCHNCHLTRFVSEITCDRKRCLSKLYDLSFEYSLFDHDEEFNPICYEMIKPYDYLKIYGLSSYNEFSKMLRDGKIKGKSIVFVNSKDLGKEQHKEIPNSVYIDADTKYISYRSNPEKVKNKKARDTLIMNETISENVLIATQALYTGINLHSKEFSNIVISSTDPNQLKQMLGRIRVKEGDTVNMYVVDVSEKDLKIWLNDINRKQKAICLYEKHIKKFEQNYYNGGTNSEFNFHTVCGFFYVKNGKIGYNYAAKVQLEYLKESLEEILDKMKNGDKIQYLRTVLKWLDKENELDDITWINYTSKQDFNNELVRFLDKETDQIHYKKDEEDFVSFRTRFQELYYLAIEDSSRKVRREDLWSCKKVNEKLEECGLNYTLENGDGYLVFRKLNKKGGNNYD